MVNHLHLLSGIEKYLEVSRELFEIEILVPHRLDRECNVLCSMRKGKDVSVT